MAAASSSAASGDEGRVSPLSEPDELVSGYGSPGAERITAGGGGLERW